MGPAQFSPPKLLHWECFVANLYICTCIHVSTLILHYVYMYMFSTLYMYTYHRSSEIDDVIEQQLADNCGFVDNFARGTAHMFK